MNAQVQSLADYTFTSKYAKYIPGQSRRETWSECVARSKQMHLDQYAGCAKQLQPFLDEAFESYENKLCVGSQRNLQFAGDAVFRHNARSYNCGGTYADRLRYFQEVMYVLLCGTGPGFSVQKHHIAKLPDYDLNEKTEIISYEIEDSIEGWADSIGILVNSYMQDSLYPEYQGKAVKFIYKNIREKGALFSHGIGLAPGPEPLRKAHEKIRKLMDDCISAGRTRLRPIDVYDITMHASDAVLAGGIRRSATICIFSVDDEEMMNAKTGNWFVDNPQRARSNNSALLLKSTTTKEQFKVLIEKTRQFGEPGFYWSDSTEMLPNPCFPDQTWIMTKDGPRQIKDLIGKPFEAYVNGKLYKSSDKGFFETGVRKIYKLNTLEGYSVSATDNHQFLTINNGIEEWKELKDMQIGDEIVVHNHGDSMDWDGSGETEAEGWLVGNLLGDGFVSGNTGYLDYWGDNRNEMREHALTLLKEEELSAEHVQGCNQSATVGKVRVQSVKLAAACAKYGIVHGNKNMSDSVEYTSSSFYKGFIRGYFDADGSVQSNHGLSIRLTSVNMHNLEIVQRMLLRLGIYAKLYKDRRPAGERKIGDGVYACQAVHELIITRSMAERFYSVIGFADQKKQNQLHNYIAAKVRNPYTTKFVATVESVVPSNVETVYDCTIDEVHAFDANGFYSHNCVEISFYCYDDEGNSGWQFCNLSTVNGSKIKTLAEFKHAARSATIIGTLQAGYTSFPYLGPVTEKIVRREALLGVSITGIMESPNILLNPEYLKEVSSGLAVINQGVASIIGINPAARITCIKPEGSTSCMLGTSSGIHPHHSRRYIRRVQANKMEAPAQLYTELNPRASEHSSWSANNTDMCISFACEVPAAAVFKDQISAVEMLEIVKNVQTNWVASGHNVDLCTQPWLSHNVSNTVVVRDNEWEAVEKFIYDNRAHFAGISLLGSSGDKDYTQAPFSEVFTPTEIVNLYGDASLFASGLIEEAMNTFGDLWKACACVYGHGEDLTEKKVLDHEERHRQDKLAWVSRVKRFAKKYLHNDLMKATYLLKDVYNWKMWLDVIKEHKKVDFSNLEEHRNTTTGAQEAACAGGACMI